MTTRLPRINLLNICLIIFIVFAGLYFRRPDGFTHPQIYAEDGPVFFQQSVELGLKSLITPYAGYLHTIPRLIALAFRALDASYTVLPMFYNYCYFALCVLVALQLFRSAMYLELKHKLLFATIFLFVPIGPEMFMNITNSIWVTSLFLVNFLFVGHKYYEQESKFERWAILGGLFVVSLTGPFSLLLSPIVCLIIFLERKSMTVQKLIPMGIILLCGAIQVFCIKFIPTDVNRTIPGEPEHWHFLQLIILNMKDLSFFSLGLFPDVSDRWLKVICLLLFALLCLWLVYNYRRLKIDRKYILLLAPLVYLGSFIAVFWPMESRVLAFICPRYYFVPYTCFAWILILSLDQVMRISDVVVYFAFFLLHTREERYRLGEKNWRGQIQEYYEGKRSVIDINPEGWRFTLPPKK